MYNPKFYVIQNTITGDLYQGKHQGRHLWNDCMMDAEKFIMLECAKLWVEKQLGFMQPPLEILECTVSYADVHTTSGQNVREG